MRIHRRHSEVGGNSWISSTIAIAALGILGVLSSGCVEATGACVTHDYEDSPAVHFCHNDEMEGTCGSSGGYLQDFYADQSCAAVGFPFYCTTLDFEKHGLSGASRYISNAACDPRRP